MLFATDRTADEHFRVPWPGNQSLTKAVTHTNVDPPRLRLGGKRVIGRAHAVRGQGRLFGNLAVSKPNDEVRGFGSVHRASGGFLGQSQQSIQSALRRFAGWTLPIGRPTVGRSAPVRGSAPIGRTAAIR